MPGVEPLVKAHSKAARGQHCGQVHRRCLGGRARHRLFDKDVPASLKRGGGVGGMPVDRRREVDRLHAGVGEEVVKAVVHAAGAMAECERLGLRSVTTEDRH